MSDLTGHLFVIQGDLTRLSCDGVLVPCDGGKNVSRWWFDMFEQTPRTTRPWEPLPPAASLRPTRRGPVAHQLVDTVSVGGDVERLVAAVREGLETLAGKVRTRAGAGRVLPLLALPLPGTGQGGLSHRRGAVVGALVPALERCARDLGVDIVLVDRARRDFAAIQSLRETDGWDISQELVSQADRLGELAARGELSVFVGAGVSVPLGLPGWEELVNLLLHQAALDPLIKGADEPELLDAAGRAKEVLGDDYSGVLGELLTVHHHALAHGLVASLRARQTVTTNFDCALELAMERTHGEELKILTAQWAGQASPWLLKLHGTAGETDVVLTKEDYERHRWEDGQPLYALVQGLLMTSHLLFVGFSMTDSNYLRLADPVARLYARAGGKAKVATALGLKSLADEDRVLDHAFHHISFDREVKGIEVAARTLEIFLDRVVWRSTVLRQEAHSYLLDDRYSDLVDRQEQKPLKQALNRLREAVAGMDGPAANRVRDHLAEFGALPDFTDGPSQR